MDHAVDIRSEPGAGTPTMRTPRTMRWLQRSRSIRVRLYMAFMVLLLLVLGLGVFSIQRLGDVSRVSEEIRNHWLQDTRILGDLSNYMSDFRAAEATHLLSSTPMEFTASEREIDSLSAIVAASQRAYEAIPQQQLDQRLYARFSAQWAGYQALAAHARELARDGHRDEGVAVYMTASRRAFDLASNTLTQLTDQTVSEAHVASARAAAAYPRARALIATAMLLVVLLLVGVILFITYSILNPLLVLASRMRALANHDTDIAVPSATRADEVGEMARSVVVFRDNAVALMGSQRRLIEQAAKLETALENEQQLTVQQRNFVSMTSHEFRTPLTIIDAHAQRLIKMAARLDPAGIADRGARIRSAVQRMTNIMDSLLGASRLLDARLVYRPAHCDPAILLREACQTHREATRGARILESFKELPATILADSQLLFHAFSNLISNAIKFSPAGSPITVAAHQEPGWLVVEVHDHGIGIPARDRQRLFQRYFRGGNATGIAGTGVGLHLVAMVVELHQGEVFAESLEGVGSTFFVRLPISASADSMQASSKRDVG